MLNTLMSGAMEVLQYFTKKSESKEIKQEVNRIIREKNRLLKENRAKDELINKQKIQIAKLKQKLQIRSLNSDAQTQKNRPEMNGKEKSGKRKLKAINKQTLKKQQNSQKDQPNEEDDSHITKDSPPAEALSHKPYSK